MVLYFDKRHHNASLSWETRVIRATARVSEGKIWLRKVWACLPESSLPVILSLMGGTQIDAQDHYGNCPY